MSIAYDTVVNASFGGSATTTKTWSHTCSGSDRIIFVQTLTDGNNVSGVTYGGVAMTRVYGQTTDFYSTIYALPNPATGANNVVVTCSVAQNIIPMSVSYTGAKNEVPTISNTGSGSSPLSVSVTTTADNSWLLGYVRKTTSGTITAGAGTTLRASDTTYGLYTCDSGAPTTPAGSDSLNITYTGTCYMGIVAFAPATAATSHIKSADGILYANIKSADGVTN